MNLRLRLVLDPLYLARTFLLSKYSEARCFVYIEF